MSQMSKLRFREIKYIVKGSSTNEVVESRFKLQPSPHFIMPLKWSLESLASAVDTDPEFCDDRAGGSNSSWRANNIQTQSNVEQWRECWQTLWARLGQLFSSCELNPKAPIECKNCTCSLRSGQITGFMYWIDQKFHSAFLKGFTYWIGQNLHLAFFLNMLQTFGSAQYFVLLVLAVWCVHVYA